MKHVFSLPNRTLTHTFLLLLVLLLHARVSCRSLVFSSWGSFSDCSCDYADMDHGVQVVGFQILEKEKVPGTVDLWQVRNSWGQTKHQRKRQAKARDRTTTRGSRWDGTNARFGNKAIDRMPWKLQDDRVD